MEVSNKVYPNKAQIEGFSESGVEGQICMVNLLKFKPKAEYPDGRETNLTGKEAYHIYSEGVMRLLKSIGGYIGFAGDVSRLTLGEVDELWDAVVLAFWPSRQAMLELMQSDAMQEISIHRTAGLAGQLNIETTNFSGSLIKS